MSIIKYIVFVKRDISSTGIHSGDFGVIINKEYLQRNFSTTYHRELLDDALRAKLQNCKLLHFPRQGKIISVRNRDINELFN